MSTVQSSHSERSSAGLLVCVAAALLGIGLSMLGLAAVRVLHAAPALLLSGQGLSLAAMTAWTLGMALARYLPPKPASVLLAVSSLAGVAAPLLFLRIEAGLAALALVLVLSTAALSHLQQSTSPLALRAPHYFFLGAAGGLLLCVAILRIAGAPSAIFGAASLFAAAAACLGAIGSSRSRVAGTGLALLMVILLTFAARGRLFEFSPQQGESVYVRWNHDSRVAVARLPDSRLEVTIDRRTLGPMASRSQPASLPAQIIKRLRPGARVLVLGSGGGAEVRAVLDTGSRNITAVEANSIVSRLLMQREHPEWTGYLFRQPEVRLINEEPFSFLRQSSDRFQAILLSESMPPAGALTADQFTDCLLRLEPEGILLAQAAEKKELNIASGNVKQALRNLGQNDDWEHVFGLLDTRTGRHHLLAFRKSTGPWDFAAALKDLPIATAPVNPVPPSSSGDHSSFSGFLVAAFGCFAASNWSSRWSLLAAWCFGWLAANFVPFLYPFVGLLSTGGLAVAITAFLGVSAGLRQPLPQQLANARAAFALLTAGTIAMLLSLWAIGPLVDAGFGWPAPLRVASSGLLILPGAYALGRLSSLPIALPNFVPAGAAFPLRILLAAAGVCGALW